VVCAGRDRRTRIHCETAGAPVMIPVPVPSFGFFGASAAPMLVSRLSEPAVGLGVPDVGCSRT
jgi:hypothetical protein